MPNFDRTGPLGEGPLTGGGFGPCNSRNRNYTDERELSNEEMARRRGGEFYGRGLGLARGFCGGRKRSRGRRPARSMGRGLARGYGARGRR